MVHSPGRKMDAATSTSKIYGKLMTISVTRMTIISITPPK